MRRIARLGLLLVTVSACGGAVDRAPGTPNGTGNNNNTGGNTQAGAVPQALTVAHGFSEGAYGQSAQILNLLVESALTAGRQVGAPAVQQGTVVWRDGQVQYSAEPAGQLRVVAPMGTWAFQISVAEGNPSSTEAFFDGDHRLTVHATSDAGSDLDLSSSRAGVQRQARVTGKAVVEGVTYDLDLTFSGQERFETDSTGTSYNADLATTGWAEGPDFHLEVDETWRFELVAGNGPGGFVANSAQRTVRGGLMAGGHVYGFRDIETKRAFRDGKPTELDTYWSAQGEVLQDGLQWGHVGMRVDVVDPNSGGFVRFVLQSGAGDVVLESYAAY